MPYMAQTTTHTIRLTGGSGEQTLIAWGLGLDVASAFLADLTGYKPEYVAGVITEAEAAQAPGARGITATLDPTGGAGCLRFLVTIERTDAQRGIDWINGPLDTPEEDAEYDAVTLLCQQRHGVGAVGLSEEDPAALWSVVCEVREGAAS